MNKEFDPEGMIEKIRGLLAKAEGTNNPHEAEAFFAKAAELMEKYRIDAEVVRRRMGRAEEDVEGIRYPLAQRAKYLRPSLALLCVTAKHFAVRVVIGAKGNSKMPALVGTPTDVEATILMFESLVLQRDHECLNTPVRGNANQFRSSFGYGYATRIGERLEEIRKATMAVVHDVEDTMALAVIDRRIQRVDAFLAGKTSKANQNAPTIDRRGMRAGDEAAGRADLGQRRMDSGPRAIGAG